MRNLEGSARLRFHFPTLPSQSVFTTPLPRLSHSGADTRRLYSPSPISVPPVLDLSPRITSRCARSVREPGRNGRSDPLHVLRPASSRGASIQRCGRLQQQHVDFLGGDRPVFYPVLHDEELPLTDVDGTFPEIAAARSLADAIDRADERV